MALRRLAALFAALAALAVTASSAQAARFVHFTSPRSVTVGRIRCVSATAGVTCRRTDGRRVGFTVSREAYRVYR